MQNYDDERPNTSPYTSQRLSAPGASPVGDPGLRERKRRATKRAIEEAAVLLAYENGYEAATLEAICKTADVSLRTFFNYFPGKDVAILGGMFSSVCVERALAILEEHAPDVLGGALAAWVENAPQEHDPELTRRRREVARAHPQLMHMRMTALAEHQEEVTVAVAAFLRQHPGLRCLGPGVSEEEEAQITVSLVSSAARHAVDRWVLGESEVPLNPGLIEGALEKMSQVLGKDR